MADYESTEDKAKPYGAKDEEEIIEEAKEKFRLAEQAESENRKEALDDIKFARLGEQWPENIRRQREIDGRPCLTVNRMNAFIRQVVNDARQNKPSIKVHPVDSSADPETAEIISGLIRNIEYTSGADVAYDTGMECAVTGGVGYWKVDIDFAFEDTFDLDICIKRISNPFSIYGDPNSTEADSSDWNCAFELDWLSTEEFERLYKNNEKVDWDSEYGSYKGAWFDGEYVTVAKYWKREEYDKDIVLLSDGTVHPKESLETDPNLMMAIELGGLQIVRERTTKCNKVKRCILTAAEVLEEEAWPGRYIPIIPVYGDEVDIEGERHFRSLIRDAKDPQRMFNYWRTAATELVALAPRVPFIGPKGAFKTDADKWGDINQSSYAYVEYDGATAPQRQPLDSGPAAGALQEAANSQDDMKSVLGMYDASLGARSNEISGKAIMARQREGDISTFHFIDNMARAIRHTGRIIIDLIPHVYSEERIIRVLGEDESQESAAVNQEVPETDENGEPMMQEDEMGNQIPMTRIYDLTAGKYDLTVTTGPSFTTRREEAAAQMTELIRAYPDAAPIIGDLLAKNLDWPGADEIAERLQKMLPDQVNTGIPPEIAEKIEEGAKLIEELQTELESLKTDKSIDVKKLELDATNTMVDQYKAETERMKVMHDMQKPDPVPHHHQPHPE